MSNGTVLEEIKRVVEAGEDSISVKGTLALILAAQIEIVKKVEDLEECVRKSLDRVEQVEIYQEKNPSITWLMKNKPKQTLIISFGLWLLMLVFLGVIIFSKTKGVGVVDALLGLFF